MNKPIFGIVFLMASLALQAQETDPDGRYYTPTALFYTPKFSASELSRLCNSDFKQASNNTGFVWQVYSDRKGNALYDGPSLTSGTKPTTLDFHEPAKVIGAAPNGWLLLTTADRSGGADAPIGWIKAQNLIISRQPLVNREGNYRKVMILPSIDQAMTDGTIDVRKMEFSAFQSAPSTRSSYFISEAKKLRVYFVIKEQSGYLLLAKTDDITNQREIMGWVPEESVTPWDRRIAYGPAYGANGAAHQGRKIPVFRNENDLEKYQNRGYPTDPGSVSGQLLECTTDDTPPPASSLHMPDIGSRRSTGDIRRNVVTIARIGGRDQQKAQDEALAKLNALKDQRKKLNVVFVMDATESMQPYFGAVANSISAIVKSAKDISKGTNIKFGGVVYRDYEDGSNMLETMPLTADAEDFSIRINNIKCFSNDRDLPEAMYMGITQGLEELGLVAHRNETNLVILIGDAGNKPHPNGQHADLNEVFQTLDACKANIISFQPHNRPDWSFQSFRDDVLSIIQTRSESQIQFKPQKSGRSQYYNVRYASGDDETWKFFGAISFPLGNKQTISARVLEDMVIETTGDFLQRLDGRIESLEKIELGQPITQDMIDDWAGQISAADIEVLRSIGDFSFRAHAVVEVPDTDAPCLVPYVFMTDKDLKQRQKVFNRIAKAKNTKKFAEDLQDVLIETAASLLGEVNDEGEVSDATRTKIGNQTLGELWAQLFLTQCQFKNIRDIRIEELMTYNDDLDVQSDLQTIAAQAKKFAQKDFRGRETYSFNPPGASDDEVFYWIPLTEFPGAR